jgi:hypothetical protein
MSSTKTTHILKSPKKVKLRKKVSEIVDDFEMNAIRRKVHDFYFAMSCLVPSYWFSTHRPIKLQIFPTLSHFTHRMHSLGILSST